MTLYIGSDHAGYAFKEEIKAYLAARDVAVDDLGCPSTDSVDYPDYAVMVAQAVAADPAHRGILVCGTGIGVSIAANKVAGVRAALCHTEFEAEMCRLHNDANIICVGSRTTGMGVVLRLIDRFLATEFEGGRHARRVAKINDLD